MLVLFCVIYCDCAFCVCTLSKLSNGAVYASMEGKTKEALESVSLALFCLAMQYTNPMNSWCKLRLHNTELPNILQD